MKISLAPLNLVSVILLNAWFVLPSFGEPPPLIRQAKGQEEREGNSLTGNPTLPKFAETAALAPSATLPATKAEVAPPTRALDEPGLKELLTRALQDQYVQDKGELELRLTRPWSGTTVPDAPLAVHVLDIPTKGVTSHFILRFELRTAGESLGSWQVSLQARVWREVWVARSTAKRGEALADADLVRERRDILNLRDLYAGDDSVATEMELAESVPAGVPLYARAVKPRTVVRRGQVLEAVVREGSLAVSLKVEALEDGAFGQQIRVRNVQSRKEIRGKVQNEQSILVSL